jgi:hypothetical protein
MTSTSGYLCGELSRRHSLSSLPLRYQPYTRWPSRRYLPRSTQPTACTRLRTIVWLGPVDSGDRRLHVEFVSKEHDFAIQLSHWNYLNTQLCSGSSSDRRWCSVGSRRKAVNYVEKERFE